MKVQASWAYGGGAVTRRIGALIKNAVPSSMACQAKTAEIIEKAVVESAGALEPIDFISREAKILQKIDRLLQPGGEQKAAPRHQTADLSRSHA